MFKEKIRQEFREFINGRLDEAKEYKYHIQLRGMDTAEWILKDLKIKDAEIHSSHFYSMIMTNNKNQFNTIMKFINNDKSYKDRLERIKE